MLLPSFKIFNQSSSMSSLASHDMERIMEPPIARFHDPVAFKLFRRVSDVPIQNKYYAYFVVNRVNEVGFATNGKSFYSRTVFRLACALSGSWHFPLDTINMRRPPLQAGFCCCH